jgi:ABC-type Na+ efflux pump permease subunit
VSGTYLLRHFTLPVLVTISSLVTPSIVMGDVLFGERERRTLDLLVALPVSAHDVVLAKLAAVLLFAISVTVPLFALNVLMVSAFGYSSVSQTVALVEVLLAAVAYSASSGLLLGPIVPIEGLILTSTRGDLAITACAAGLALLTCGALFWSARVLSFERLFGKT